MRGQGSRCLCPSPLWVIAVQKSWECWDCTWLCENTGILWINCNSSTSPHEYTSNFMHKPVPFSLLHQTFVKTESVHTHPYSPWSASKITLKTIFTFPGNNRCISLNLSVQAGYTPPCIVTHVYLIKPAFNSFIHFKFPLDQIKN